MSALRSGAAAQSFIVELSTLEEIVEGVVDQTVTLLSGTSPSFDAVAFKKEVSTLVSQGKLLELVYKLLSGISGTFAVVNLNDAEDEEDEDDSEEAVEVLFSLLFTLVKHVDAAKELPGIVTEVCKIVSSTVDETTRVARMRILRNLYAILDPSSPLRPTVFLTLMRFAHSARLQGGLQLDTMSVRDLCDAWNVDIETKREILLLSCKALFASGRSNQAHPLNLDYVQTFNGASVSELSSATEMSARAALYAVKNPLDVSNFSTFDLDAVKHLENVAEHAALFGLLKVFAQGNYADYLAYAASNSGFASTLGVSESDCADQARLLTLGSLAAENVELSYESVANALQVGIDEVEAWIVRAIGLKLINAKMDQLNSIVVVNSGTARGFSNKSSWADMSKKLHTLRAGIRNILQTIQDARESSKSE